MGLVRLDRLRQLGSSSPGGYAVDIIAIHGLNGHYERTWIDRDTGTLWLRDLLSLDFPAARIYSFSYDSRILTHASMTIDDYALELLSEISSERATDKVRGPITLSFLTPQRPSMNTDSEPCSNDSGLLSLSVIASVGLS